MERTNSKQSEVAITRSKTPVEGVFNGLEELGGISKYVKDGDQVFVKFNLNLPEGFPANTDFDVLGAVIKWCKEAGAKKIYLGSFPFEANSIEGISDALGIERYFESLGAELAFIDNSNYFKQEKAGLEQLQKVKDESFTKIEKDNEEYNIPKVILDSSKLISVNQVNVNPLFKYTLAILNSYSMVPNNYRKIKKNVREGKDYFALDQYKQDLITNIFNVYSIKEPDLVINDLFYVLERAGPCIYKDSKLNKTGHVIIGNDAVAVDLVTLNLLNVEALSHELIMEARERGLGNTDLSSIIIHGEKLKESNINVEECVAKLTDINVKNVSVKQGQICSGCRESAYHLLNTMKTRMTKDLKYLSTHSFLIGESPLEPNDKQDNIIVFGDCAIDSTRDRDFRKITKETKRKIIVKWNKKVLELAGCPPDIPSSIDKMVKHYKKRDIPLLNLYYKTINHKNRKALESWEAL
jgi:uncharacterized protein (DUF362 family)